MRLNRFLSLCGLGSRRGVEALIAEGQVSINGSYIRSLGTAVGDDDEVRVNGRIMRPAKGVVLALHKPKGYVCSRGDTHDRLTIYDLLPAKFQNLHHVGRLDKESEGLLLMTNRGDLSHRLMHPSQGVEKEYEVVVDKPLDPEVHFPKLVKGMVTPEGFAKAERVWAENSHYRFHLVLKQGLKRQIRHMLYFLGFEVERLIRVRIGWLAIKGLTKGGYKELTETEVTRFFSDTKPVSTAPKKASSTKEKSPPKAKKSSSEDAFEPEEPAPTRSRPLRTDGRKRTAASTARPKRDAPPKEKSKFDSHSKSPRSRSKRPGQSEGYGKDRPQSVRKSSAPGKTSSSSSSSSRSPARKKPSSGGKRPPGRGKR